MVDALRILGRPRWRRMFRRFVTRRAQQVMAIELLDEGPDSDWRAVGDDMRRALGLPASED